MIPYNRHTLDDDDITEVLRALKSSNVTRGPITEEFERAVAEYCNVDYAVSFNNGTSALYAAYRAAGVKNNDNIITTPITFCATVNTAVLCGARPIFVDIDFDTGLIDPVEIDINLDSKTKAIVPMDYAGQPCDMDAIMDIAGKNKIWVIEDACHSLGATYKNRKVGCLADMTVFSFHAIKTITTGEGGMVVTNNKKLFSRLQMIRNHGFYSTPKWAYPYDMFEMGLNLHMTEFQSALGLSQIKKIDYLLDARQNVADIYNKFLNKGVDGIKHTVLRSDVQSSNHLYTVWIPPEINRDIVMKEMHKQKIYVQVHYLPVYWFTYYKDVFGFKEGLCINAEKFYKGILSLPCYPYLFTTDKGFSVVDIFKGVIEKCRKMKK